MTKNLTINEVKRMLEGEGINYDIISYEYGFMIKYRTPVGVNVKYYFNQIGDYIYPTPENLATLGKVVE